MSEYSPNEPCIVLVSENLIERMAFLGQQYPSVKFVPIPAQGGQLLPEYRKARAMFRSSMSEELFDQILDNAPLLEWVQISAAGFDWMSGDALERRALGGLRITRSANSFNGPIAEYAIGAMISFARHLPALAEAQKEREWVRLVGQDFIGSTVGIFGTGAIGGELAWRVAGLGAIPIGVSRSGQLVEGFAEVFTSADIEHVLPRCDYVVLAMPLTSETRGMIGAKELALMKPGALLVNVGRGALTDTEALIAAVEGGTIAGAVLDAFVEEPLPADNPLWNVRNIWVTPHTSFRTDGNTNRLCADFCENLDKFLNNEPLVGMEKEPALGY